MFCGRAVIEAFLWCARQSSAQQVIRQPLTSGVGRVWWMAGEGGREGRKKERKKERKKKEGGREGKRRREGSKKEGGREGGREERKLERKKEEGGREGGK